MCVYICIYTYILARGWIDIYIYTHIYMCVCVYISILWLECSTAIKNDTTHTEKMTSQQDKMCIL